MADSYKAQVDNQSSGFDFSEDSSASLMETIDLQHYLRTLRKHKWMIMLFSAIITGLAAYYAYTATPVYSATSTLLIESQGDNLVQFEELIGLETENQDYYQTQFELLRSRQLAVRVVNELDLWNHPELSPRAAANVMNEKPKGLESATNLIDKWIGFLGFGSDSAILDEGKSGGTIESPKVVVLGENITSEETNLIVDVGVSGLEIPESSESDLSVDRRNVISNFMTLLSVAPVRKTKLVGLSFESEDPKFAALVANTVGEQYIESYLDAKLELTTQAQSWLNQRLGDLKTVLDESEGRLIEFKQQNGLVDVDGSVGRLNEQELLLATAELAQARSALSSQQDLFREVRNLRGQPELLQSIPDIQADPLVQQVKTEQGRAQRALDELRNRYGERHPRVVDARSQLATLNTTLQGHINRVVGTVQNDFQLTQQRVAAIESKLARGKQEIQAIGTKKFELDELEREVLINREIYNTFFSRITEARSADGLDNANARISDPAVPSVNPIKPKKQLIIVLAAFASFVLSMLMAFLYEQMDDTIKSTQDVEGKLGVKLLGLLPLIKTGRFSKPRKLPLNPAEIDEKGNRFSEAVNTVRTAITLEDSRSFKKVILVTSSVPSEGKSTTSINLAYSFGQLERVLLIDCDLRKPTVAKAAGISKDDVGLSDLILQKASAQQCIKRGMFGGSVDVLPAGSSCDQPLELLSSQRFAKILEQLGKHYDRIVLDSAPTQAVSDALVLSALSDALVYAVKSGETSIDMVRRGLTRLKQVNAPLAGIVITQVDLDKMESYGGNYYYQGYYDYYGYSEAGRDGKVQLTASELHDICSDDSEVDLGLEFGKSKSDRSSSALRQDYSDFDMTARITKPASKKPPRGKRLNEARTGSNDLDIL